MALGSQVLPVLVLVFLCLILAAAVVFQFYRAKQQRLMVEAALAAGQADVARALLTRNWPETILRVLAIWFIGLMLVAMMGATAAVVSHKPLGRSGPGTMESLAFQQKVERVIGAPLGTSEVAINGHKAHGILTGSAWAMQGCGSPYQAQLRFSTIEPGPLNVYCIPDTDQYYVFGKARVDPSGKIVENGLISTREALGEPAGAPAK